MAGPVSVKVTVRMGPNCLVCAFRESGLEPEDDIWHFSKVPALGELCAVHFARAAEIWENTPGIKVTRHWK